MQLKVILKFEGVSKDLINLEIIILLEICEKNINYQLKFTFKISLFNNSYQPFFLFGEMSLREISVWGNVLRGTLRRRNVFGELSVREISVGELSGYRTNTRKINRLHSSSSSNLYS